MPTRVAFVPVAGTPIVAANHVKFPGGWIGYVEVTSTQGSITTGTDITSLTLTVTVGTSRRLKLTGEVGFSSSVGTDYAQLQITTGANTLVQARNVATPTTPSVGVHAEAVLTPSSGSNTWKLRAARASGSGNISTDCGSGVPGFILIEDIGPSA
jgi:hypothetical protein